LQSCRVAGRRIVALAWLALAAAAAAPPAFAQRDSAAPAAAPAPGPYRVAPAIRWGKWAAAAGAVGATVLGIRQHNAGNNAYRALVLYCGGSVTCSIGPDGHYLDARAEATYRQVVRDDRSARAWLVAGQITALGSAVLFVLELEHEAGPPNIPFNGLMVESGGGVTRVGYRIPIRM
jgi:hypothetical protein